MTTRLRRLLAAAPVALGLAAGATAVTTPSSVEAATSITICLWWDGQRYCIEVPYAINWDELLCPGCPPDFRWRDDLAVNPEVVAVEVANGLSDLLVADITQDGRTHAEGIAHVERAADLAGPRLSGVPSTMGWVNGLQQDVVDAVALFKRSDAATDPALASRLRTQAIGELDRAVDQLAANVNAA